MTESGTKTMIGAFVLGALALLVVFITLLGSGVFNKKTTEFVLFFDGSLRGLTQGSPVYFKGVRVGRVSTIQISAEGREMAFVAPVIIELDNTLITGEYRDKAGESEAFMSNVDIVQELIRQGLRARLGMQSFVTGQLTVDLDIDPAEAPVDPLTLKPYHGLQQIPTVPSSLEALLHLASRMPLEEIVDKVYDVLTKMDAQLANADLGALTTSLTLTSDTLREDLHQTLTDLNALTGDSTGGLQSAVANLDRTLADISLAMRQAGNTMKDVSAFSSASRTTMTNAGALLRDDSAFMLELSQTMRSLRDASTAISQLATLLQLKPDALIFGRSGQ